MSPEFKNWLASTGEHATLEQAFEAGRNAEREVCDADAARYNFLRARGGIVWSYVNDPCQRKVVGAAYDAAVDKARGAA